MTDELLSPLEQETLTLLGKVANNMRRIVGYSSVADHDLHEMCLHIHNLQNAILAQAAARAYPNQYRLMGYKIHEDV